MASPKNITIWKCQPLQSTLNVKTGRCCEFDLRWLDFCFLFFISRIVFIIQNHYSAKYTLKWDVQIFFSSLFSKLYLSWTRWPALKFLHGILDWWVYIHNIIFLFQHFTKQSTIHYFDNCQATRMIYTSVVNYTNPLKSMFII